MKILHVSDLHYRVKVRDRINDGILAPLLKSLASQAGKIDLVVFCGDIVWAGGISDDFAAAGKYFINRILEVLQLRNDRLVMCPGNHDLDRGRDHEIVQAHFDEKINSNVQLDSFVSKSTDKIYNISIDSFENYTAFAKTMHNGDDVHPLFSVHKRQICGNNIGIVSLNSAWRAVSNDTKGRLVIPPELLKKATREIKHCYMKIAIIHHELGYLTAYNQAEIEDILYYNYDIILHGHVHKAKHAAFASDGLGALCSSCSAALSFEHENVKSGYAIIDSDLDESIARIEEFSLSAPEEEYMLVKTHEIAIPVGDAKKQKNELRRRIRERYAEELDRADELFVTGKGESNQGFLSMFTEPVLRTKKRSEISVDGIEDIVWPYSRVSECSNNLLILGRSKSGKTAILRSIQLELLNTYSETRKLPLYIDVTQLKMGTHVPSLVKIFSTFYGLSKTNSIKLLENTDIVILVDNYDPYIDDINKEIYAMFSIAKNATLVAVTEETVLKASDSIALDNLDYTKLYIDQIDRKQIRCIAEKWPNITERKKEQAIEKIISVFKQMHIPFSYWTVSLFLWVFERDTNLHMENNTELIGLYVDELLDRSRTIATRNSSPTYNALKKFLADLAGHMIQNSKDIRYAMTTIEIHEFIQEYRKKYKRFTADTTEVLNVLRERGVLRKTSDEKYCFRLKGIFEYFVAQYMCTNKKFRDMITSDERYYLAFANEMELYAGLTRNDVEYLTIIYNKVSQLYEPIVQRYSGRGTIDANLKSGYNTLLLSPSMQEKVKPITPEKRDELLESIESIAICDSDVEQKVLEQSIEACTDHLEKMLRILTRVYRNCDEIQDDSKVVKIFEKILLYHCEFGLWLIDEIEFQERKARGGEDDSDLLILRHVTNFLPIITQMMMYEGLGHANMVRVIDEVIEKYEMLSDKMEYQLFTLYMLKIDIMPELDIEYLKEIIKKVKMKAIKSSILYKMYYYIMFRCNGNGQLEKKLRKEIKDLAKDINDRYDKNSIDSGFASIAKQKLIEKQR